MGGKAAAKIGPGQTTAGAKPEQLSRRVAIRAAAGAVAGAAVAAALPAARARAADGDPLRIGDPNTAHNATSLQRDNYMSHVSLARFDVGVLATNDEVGGIGVEGVARGSNGVSLHAVTSGNHTQTGLLADTSNGVGEGISVKSVTANGVAVWAECTGGEALHVIGPSMFSRSGRDQFHEGQVSATHSSYRLTADSIVLATIQGNVSGVSVKGVVVNFEHQFFTIRLTKPAPKNLVVGWFLVN